MNDPQPEGHMASYIARRKFLATLLGGAVAAWPACAQSPAMPVIGVLGSGFAASSAIFIDAFKQGMSENGLFEGRDYLLDVRWAEADCTRFAALATELMQRKSRVIIVTTIPSVRAAQQIAPATPLVMTGLIDPVGADGKLHRTTKILSHAAQRHGRCVAARGARAVAGDAGDRSAG